MRATKAAISLANLRFNIDAVRSYMEENSGGGKAPAICMPVKADAYGHGAAAVAKAAVVSGVPALAVATVDEGAELRAAGIKAPVLLFSIPMPAELYKLAAADLEAFVSSAGEISSLAEAGARNGKPLKVHLKVDTGMGRLGCTPADAALFAKIIAENKYLSLEGTATHLACADILSEEALKYTNAQLEKFALAVENIKKAGISPGIISAAGSGAIILHKEAWFDMVRPGILLYGSHPGADTEGKVIVKPLMELSTRVTLIKKAPKGTKISYGGIWEAPEDTYIGTLPIGYGDGLPRALSGKLNVNINGTNYPVVGRICMDQCMVDLGVNPAVKRWDEAIVFGWKPGCNTPGSIAAAISTIPYEITCGIKARVERVYS
jgi:alanine racemase